MTKAVANVNTIIGPALVGLNPADQKAIDEKMVQELDGSKNEWGWSKSKLGANAILAVSMAVCKARAGWLRPLRPCPATPPHQPARWSPKGPRRS